MKYFTRIILFLFLPYISFNLASAGELTFTPGKPTQSSKLKIVYTPSVGAQNTETVTVFVYLWIKNREPNLIELPMEKNGSIWSADGNFSLDTIVYVSCKVFVGEDEDTNNDEWWGVRVNTKNGKPVEGARLAEVQSISLKKNNFSVKSRLNAALLLLEEERTSNPSSPIWSMRWQLLMMAAQNGVIKMNAAEATDCVEKEIDSLVSSSKIQSDLLDCSVWYDRLNKFDKAAAVLDTLAQRYSNQSALARKELRPLQNLRDYDLIQTALINIIKTYPDTPEALSLQTSLVQVALQTRNALKAYDYIQQYGIKNGEFIIQTARMLGEDGTKPDGAVELAKQAVELARTQPKPGYLSKKEWEPTARASVASALATYGFTLLKSNTCAEAEEVFVEAMKLRDTDDEELLRNYLECLKKNKKSKESLSIHEKIISSGSASDEQIDDYKKIYGEVNGSSEGLDERLRKLQATAFTGKFAGLKKSALNKEISAFTLDEPGGKQISLEKLKGKVVILDFWALWCGPCKQAFPYLQKVYDKFKSSSDVAIYAVNTFERVQGDARIEGVKKFMESNKLTVPILFDTDVASENGIQSIPTQFVIDKKGRLQFISVGFEGPQMVEELSAKIDLLRNEEFYK